ncbi:NmrA family transcriptional regulator, partial [Streptosporangium sandarakinum]
MPIVRVAVAGATGNIGALTATALERAGHHVIRVSRSLGVDLTTGDAELVGGDDRQDEPAAA